MHRITKRLTYANVMSSIAVFIVLGGAAYAASQLPKNSVGTKQLKKNAVIGSKVKDGSLTGADINASTLGTVPTATSASHASAADNASHATKADSAKQAESAEVAEVAIAAAAPETLASGETESGIFYGIETVGTGNTGFIGATISYPFPLPSAPVENYRPMGSSPNAACPGTAASPQAAPGNLCAYETENGTGNPAFFDGAVETSLKKYGTGIAVFMSGGTGNDDLIGTWAVTAP